MERIPVIDLFAGPGGLSEGFARDGGFHIRLSIEKDERAHQTLELRSFYRQFPTGDAPDAYYKALRNAGVPWPQRRAELFAAHPQQAAAAVAEAWHAELGRTNPHQVHARIAAALGPRRDWVLLGGPPCQAYSLVGRSRNRGNPHYNPEADQRQRLYVEFLQIIAEHQPAVFIMENVKGLLSATRIN